VADRLWPQERFELLKNRLNLANLFTQKEMRRMPLLACSAEAPLV